jgi:hypothetical protein
MEADEIQTISAMVEESSKTNESVGQFVGEAARCPATILRCPATILQSKKQ